MKKFSSFLLIAGLVLVGGFISNVHEAKAVALQNITITSAQIISSNTVSVNLGHITDNGDGGGIGDVDPTKWHIDVNGGGISPLTPASALIHNSSASAAVLYLTFSGTPFSSTSKSYIASTGLYVDAGGTTDGVGDTNVVLTDSASVAIADAQAPAFISAVATSDTNIQVAFSEAVTVAHSDGSDFDLSANGVVITGATIDSFPTKVDLTVDPLGNDGNFWSGGGLDIGGDAVEDIVAGNPNEETLNQDVSDGQVPEAPTADPDSGSYVGTQHISLSSTGSQSIRYTLDGTSPDCSTSTLYAGPISVGIGSTEINAIGCDDQGNYSVLLGTFDYTITNPVHHGGGGGGNFSSTPLSSGAAPVTCSPGQMFSATTGAPCTTTTAVFCPPGQMFNGTTGAKCNTTITTVQNGAGASSYTLGTTLVKLGTTGDACKAWQTYFNAHGASLTVDGNCGPKTIAFAKTWQASVGITADGVLGAMSRAKAI